MSSDVTYTLPVQGQWLVVWGGETETLNYHTAFPPQRHAYDLLVWRDGATYSGSGTANEDYFAWGEPVVSPAAGTVVAVTNDQPDIAPALAGAASGEATPVLPEAAPSPAADQASPAGNHVVLQTGENEFVYIAHMQQGSIDVEVGDELQPGDTVGLVGNSGNTTEPHVHIHVQSGAEYFTPETIGVPLVFTDILVDGEPVESGAPVQAQFIEQN
jgi:murein DD-endopeptidase MepM/ murein hydrolase activator NlpD